MKIAITKTVNEEIEVEFPFFATDLHSTHVVKVTEEAAIKVYDSSIFVADKRYSPSAYNEEVLACLKAKKISEDEFNERFAYAIENIRELAGVNAFSHLIPQP